MLRYVSGKGKQAVKSFFKEFRQFVSKGNVIDLAVGVMIGSAFGKITTSLVNDVFTPLLGLVLGKLNISGAFFALDGQTYTSVEAANAAGVSTLNYGAFLQSVLDFLVISFCVFLFMRLMNRLRPAKQEAPKPAPRKCPYCRTEIPEDAVRCPHCTSALQPAETKGESA